MAAPRRKSATKAKTDYSQKAHRGSSCVKIECSKYGILTASLAGAVALVSIVFSGWCYFQQERNINKMSQFADLTYSRGVRIDAYLAAHGVDTEKTFGPIPKPPSISK